MRYSGGYPVYREQCDAVAANLYRELALDQLQATDRPGISLCFAGRECPPLRRG
jgi:hypothetical protein